VIKTKGLREGTAVDCCTLLSVAAKPIRDNKITTHLISRPRQRHYIVNKTSFLAIRIHHHPPPTPPQPTSPHSIPSPSPHLPSFSHGTFLAASSCKSTSVPFPLVPHCLTPPPPKPLLFNLPGFLLGCSRRRHVVDPLG